MTSLINYPAWTSISDQLPPLGEWVLVYNPEIESNPVHEDRLDYVESDRELYWKRGINITHWMPLPAPPTEASFDE